MKTLRAPFPYFGGKSRIAEQIVDMIPPHEFYVEPFAGAASVFLAKPKATIEVLNDLDGELINFWKVLRDHPEELARVCAATPHSRIEYLTALEPAPESTPALERARRTFIKYSQGRAGSAQRAGWRLFKTNNSMGMPGYLSAYCQRLPEVAARLSNVTLESRPAIEIIREYGTNPDAVLYVDPPYLASERSNGGYAHDMGDESSHIELLEACKQASARVLLSAYPSKIYAQHLKGWHPHVLIARTQSNAKQVKRTEIVWTNYEPQPTLFTQLETDK